MRFINLFIASSIVEFERERVYIGDHIRRFNDKSYKEGYYVKLYLCEDDLENLQAIYDRKIENCDLFVALVGEKLGDKTKHELYVAECSDKIKSRHIIVSEECNLSIIPQELLSSFKIHVINLFNREFLFYHIDSCIHSIVGQIKDTHYSPAIKEFSLSIPNNNSYELAIISNIVRSVKDNFEDELHLIVSMSATDRNNAYLSLLSENQNEEYERLLRIASDEDQKCSIWLFENVMYRSYTNESVKKVIDDLYKYGNYNCITYKDNEQLHLKFHSKLVDALNIYKSFIEVKYSIVNHILYEESQKTYKKKFVKNLLLTDYNAKSQVRLEQNIVNIINSYVITRQFDKLKESLIKLDKSDFEYFIFNPDIIRPDLSYVEYYKALVKYIYDSIEYLNFNTTEYDGDDIKNKLNEIFHINIERGVLLKPSDEFRMYYLGAKLLLSYNDQYEAVLECYVKAYEAFNQILGNKPVYANYVKEVIIDTCEIYFDLNDNTQLLEWTQKGKKFVDANDIAYKVKLLVYEARGNCDHNPKLADELYDEAISGLVGNELYKQEDDLLDLYIIVSFEIVFSKYRSIALDTDKMQVLRDQMLALDELHNKYLRNSNCWRSKLYILYMLGLLNRDMELCGEADRLLDSHRDERLPFERICDLEYIKALIHKKNHEYKESNEILLKLAKLYKGAKSKASCFQIIGTNYSYMCTSEESLRLAKEYYSMALELDADLGSNIYEGLSYCCLMTKDFQEAEKYARKAMLEDVQAKDNIYANYISSLLCQNKFIKAFITYVIVCKRKEAVKRILLQDWTTDLKELGIKTSRFHVIFLLDKKIL